MLLKKSHDKKTKKELYFWLLDIFNQSSIRPFQSISENEKKIVKEKLNELQSDLHLGKIKLKSKLTSYEEPEAIFKNLSLRQQSTYKNCLLYCQNKVEWNRLNAFGGALHELQDFIKNFGEGFNDECSLEEKRALKIMINGILEIA